jgi:hypothetical protein
LLQHTGERMAVEQVAELQVLAEHVEGFVAAEALELGGVDAAVALPLMTGLPMSEINGCALPLNPDCLVKSGIRLPS